MQHAEWLIPTYTKNHQSLAIMKCSNCVHSYSMTAISRLATTALANQPSLSFHTWSPPTSASSSCARCIARRLSFAGDKRQKVYCRVPDFIFAARFGHFARVPCAKDPRANLQNCSVAPSSGICTRSRMPFSSAYCFSVSRLSAIWLIASR